MSTTNAIAGYGPTTRRGRRPTGQLYRTKTKSPPGASYAVRFRWNGERLYRDHRPLRGRLDEGQGGEGDRAPDERAVGRRLGPGGGRPGGAGAGDRGGGDASTPSRLGWLEKQRASGGRNGDGLSESGEQDLAWCLDHLRAWFGGMRLSEITTEEVERFVHAKRTSPRGGDGPNAGTPLSGTSVRKFVRVLRSILAVAVRWERIPRNPAEGVRVKAPRFKGTSLDSADAIRRAPRRGRRRSTRSGRTGAATGGSCSRRSSSPGSGSRRRSASAGGTSTSRRATCG